MPPRQRRAAKFRLMYGGRKQVRDGADAQRMMHDAGEVQLRFVRRLNRITPRVDRSLLGSVDDIQR